MSGKFAALREPVSSPVKGASRSPLLIGIVGIFVVGLLVGVSYASHTGTPVVSHGVLETLWDVFALSPTAKADGTHFVQAMNAASGSLPNQGSGINADLLDGLDSTDFSGAAGSGGVYVRSCSWVAKGFEFSPVPFVKDYLETTCEDQTGDNSTGQPPTCALGDTDVGVDCFATGVNVWKSPTTYNYVETWEYDITGPDPNRVTGALGNGNFTCSGDQCPEITTTVGVCQRICKVN